MVEYREKLLKLNEWDSYLLKQSRLPRPRANVERTQVVADAGNLELFRRYTGYAANQASMNSPFEFPAFCNVVGLGRLLAEGNIGLLDTLRIHASDRRCQIREAVAMALKRFGDTRMDQLIATMREHRKKARLSRFDAEWVEKWRVALLVVYRTANSD
jgi:hypothetical protein